MSFPTLPWAWSSPASRWIWSAAAVPKILSLPSVPKIVDMTQLPRDYSLHSNYRIGLTACRRVDLDQRDCGILLVTQRGAATCVRSPAAGDQTGGNTRDVRLSQAFGGQRQ